MAQVTFGYAKGSQVLVPAVDAPDTSLRCPGDLPKRVLSLLTRCLPEARFPVPWEKSMIQAPLPHDENQRLKSLHDLLILDTPPEQRFDRISAFAAKEFDMPMAMVSLVDQNRQWFKSKIGLDACETARDVSFCGHVVAQSEPLVIPDALDDPRFADNPLVTGPPFVRFYAGAGLRLPCGQVVGTLCVLDQSPRSFDRLDLAILCGLRDLVVAELLRREEVTS
jgi:GAF domain-containing protein